MSDRSRLVWRCRRGTLELDLLLSRFLEQRYESLAPDQRQAFERLLDCEDDQLQDFFFNDRRPTDGALAELVELIRPR